MKRNKILLVLLALIGVAFFGVTVAKAANTQSQTIANGQSFDIPKKNWKLTNSTVTCKTEGLNHIKIQEFADKYRVTYPGDGEVSGSEKISCTETSAGVEYPTDVNFNFVRSSTMTIKGTQTEDLDANGNILKNYPFIKRIINSSVTEGAEYIELDCNPGTSCTVRAADAAFDDGTHKAVIHLTFEDVEGNETTMDINIDIEVWGSVRAYPGGYQTCAFNESQWRNDSGKYSGNTNFYTAKTAGNVTLPNCGEGQIQDNSGLPIIFAGWVKTNVSLTVQNQGVCSSGALGAYKGLSDTIAGNSGGNYHTCYEYVPMVRIAVNGANLTDTAWKSTRTAFEGVTSGIYYQTAPTADSTINLPDKLEGEFSASTNKAVTAWVNQRTGESVAPGTAVKADGSIYYAQYDFVLVGSDKSIFVNMTDKITVVGYTVTGCSSANEAFVKAQFINGECMVTGVAATGENRVSVFVSFKEQETQAEYSFAVHPDYSEFGDSFIFQPYIQDEGIFGEETGKNGISTGQEWCDIYKAGSNGPFFKIVCEKTEVALCLDPGTPAPPEDGAYQVDHSATGIPQIKAMIRRLQELSDQWSNHDDGDLQAMNSIFRVAFIACGYSYFSPAEGYQAFLPNANALKAGDWQSSANAYCGGKSWCSEVIKEYVEMKTLKNGTYELIKRAETTDITDRGYTINYTGEIRIPNTVGPISSVDSSHCSQFTGATCLMTLGDPVDDEETKRRIYSFEAQIIVSDASVLKVPVTDEEKKEASFILNSSNVPYDIFVTQNAQGGATQRLLTPPDDGNKIYVYLSPAPASCLTLDSTDLKTCEANDPNCNETLFIETGCCSLVIDEQTYPHLAELCGSRDCAYNTLGQVCDFVSNSNHNGEASQIYHIREGYLGNTENLQHCVVNSQDDFDIERLHANRGTGMSHDYTINQGTFIKYDAAGNQLNSGAYVGNRYCQVSCKEDWDFSLGAFGNYMGAEAVTAGSYFQINKSDIFIKGVRTCYTTKLKPQQYIDEMREVAKRMIEAWNTYSNEAHALAAHWFVGEETQYKGKESFSYWRDSSTGFSKSGGSSTSGIGDPGICTQYNNVTITQNHWVPLTGKALIDCKKANGGDSTYCGNYVASGTRTYENACTINTTGSENVDGPSQSEWTDPKDGLVPIQIPTNFHISDKYNDGTSAGNGNFEWWDPSKTAGAAANGDSKNAYNKHAAAVKCTGTMVPQQRDRIECTVDGVGSITVLEPGEYGYRSSLPQEEMWKALIGNGNSDVKFDSDNTTVKGTMHLYRTWVEKTKEEAKGAMEGAKSQVQAANVEMQQYANLWFKCENYSVYTSTYKNDNAHMDTVPDMLALGSPNAYTKVGTEFDPIVTYSYDEKNYMNILAEEFNDLTGQKGANMLIPNKEKNGYEIKDNAAVKLGTNDSAIGFSKDATIQITDENGVVTDYPDQVLVSVKNEEYYSTGNVLSASGSFNGTNYTGAGGSNNVNDSQSLSICYVGTHTDTVQGNSKSNSGIPYVAMERHNGNGWRGAFKGSLSDTTGHCYTVQLEYREYNYAKKSVANSGFYINKGYWYTHVTSVIAHGDNAVKAIDNINKITSNRFQDDNDGLAQWARLGSFNVFPVAMTTPRNLYQYTYLFANIGSYLDGKAGRLMGDDDSVFQNNTRSCFYEVIETICNCCGDPVEYHTVDTKGTNTAASDMDSDTDIREIYAERHNLKKKTSDKKKVRDSKSGSMGFYNTVSSLTSLSTLNENGEDRTLAANWGDQSIFNYNGYNRYVTNKGSVAAKAIEAIGEDIYAKPNGDVHPEYAYRLTPEAINTIRQDNLSNSYGVNFDKLNTYGRTLMVPESGQYNVAHMEEHINFAHYGSQFLEGTMRDFLLDIDGRTYDLTSTEKVCIIDEKETTGNGQAVANRIVDKVNSGCRWIDYIESVNSTPNGGDETGPFRLAFK